MVVQVKPYIPSHQLDGKEQRLHYYTNHNSLVGWTNISEDVVGHRYVARRKNKHTQ